jgi:aspartyl-tRNA(Asn)/glutamyl-tRNA(Gln) amidotransferase subunit C
VPAEPALSAAEVRKVARLARLALTDDQVEQYRSQLSAVLSYVERLRELDLSGVEPLAQVGDQVNRLQTDAVGPALPTEALLTMAPETMGSYLKVPKVLDEGGAA